MIFINKLESGDRVESRTISRTMSMGSQKSNSSVEEASSDQMKRTLSMDMSETSSSISPLTNFRKSMAGSNPPMSPKSLKKSLNKSYDHKLSNVSVSGFGESTVSNFTGENSENDKFMKYKNARPVRNKVTRDKRLEVNSDTESVLTQEELNFVPPTEFLGTTLI